MASLLRGSVLAAGSEPSEFTQVVDVSVRSDRASTRLPDSRAATRADAMSAASVGYVAAFGDEGTGGAAMAAPV